jgi:Micrococcal nuclease (thermonuclease) homologs
MRGNVLAVEDSDRVKVAADDGKVYSATLIGVDAPDEKQSYFKKAKKRLAELVDGKDVTVMLRSDEKNESYAVVYVGADDVGLRLIRDGLAWYSPGRSGAQSSADREKYQQAQSAAKASKTGLWDDKDAIAPWTFRGEKSECRSRRNRRRPLSQSQFPSLAALTSSAHAADVITSMNRALRYM